MIKRLLIVLCVLVTMDMLLLAAMSYFIGWRIPLEGSIVAVVVGMAVIVGYRSRWSRAISEGYDLDHPDAGSGQHCFSEMLLLAAGILFVIPGLIGDVIALLLLVPWVRRQVARSLWPQQRNRLDTSTLEHAETGRIK